MTQEFISEYNPKKYDREIIRENFCVLDICEYKNSYLLALYILLNEKNRRMPKILEDSLMRV